MKTPEKRLKWLHDGPVPHRSFLIRKRQGQWKDILGCAWEQTAVDPPLWCEKDGHGKAEEIAL